MIGSIELIDNPITDSVMNCHYNPTSPHSPYSPARTNEPFSDSNLKYISNEEVDGLMVETKIIGLLSAEFWSTEGQPRELCVC